MQDEAAGILVAHGALGCEIRGFARGRDHRDAASARVLAYFDRLDGAALRRLTTMLSKAGMLSQDSPPAIMRLEDPGWATMWQKRFEPFPVGARLLVVPPWNRLGAGERIAIVIRPGQAFGTGHHATTYGTLSVVEQIFESGRCERALDVGTGSGILAIAMRKLGAKQVIAIDLDPIALENAQENAELNDVQTGLRLTAAPLGSIRGRFDVITANILSAVLIEMAPQLKTRIKRGGHLVLGGILAREADAVMKVYNKDFRWLHTRADGAWRVLHYQG